MLWEAEQLTKTPSTTTRRSVGTEAAEKGTVKTGRAATMDHRAQSPVRREGRVVMMMTTTMRKRGENLRVGGGKNGRSWLQL